MINKHQIRQKINKHLVRYKLRRAIKIEFIVCVITTETAAKSQHLIPAATK